MCDGDGRYAAEDHDETLEHLESREGCCFMFGDKRCRVS